VQSILGCPGGFEGGSSGRRSAGAINRDEGSTLAFAKAKAPARNRNRDRSTSGGMSLPHEVLVERRQRRAGGLSMMPAYSLSPHCREPLIRPRTTLAHFFRWQGWFALLDQLEKITSPAQQGAKCLPLGDSLSRVAAMPSCVLVADWSTAPGSAPRFEKAALVAKLRHAREAKRAATGRCEGGPPVPDVVIAEARRLARKSPKTGKTRRLRAIAGELTKLGHSAPAAGRTTPAASLICCARDKLCESPMAVLFGSIAGCWPKIRRRSRADEIIAIHIRAYGLCRGPLRPRRSPGSTERHAVAGRVCTGVMISAIAGLSEPPPVI
jgi:hypothetical protein